MASGPTTLDFVTLGIALWGACFSTYLGVSRRRRRLMVSAEWGTAHLGPSRNQTFFIVSLVNTGERAVAIREVEWMLDDGDSRSLEVFRHCKGTELPVQVEPDEDVRVLYDSLHAANMIAPSGYGAKAIKVIEAARRRTWELLVTDPMRDEAEAMLQEAGEQAREPGDEAATVGRPAPD